MKAVEERLRDEQDFHNQIFEEQTRDKVGRFYAINKSIHESYEDFILSHPQSKTYLEYGCGMGKGDRLEELAKQGANCHGIDISDYAINQLSGEAQEKKLNIDYQVMNAEEMTFKDDYFDVIFGTGILHHLDLEKAYKSISEKLKPDGTAIFIEPLGHNPIINGFRNKTPEIRTEDEHPLLMKDLKQAESYFENIEVKHFYLTTLALPLVFKKNIPNGLLKFFNGVDGILFKILPFLRKHSWQVLLKFSGSKR
ncbi:MAG: class I SAM-dependent methyltransferase [Allomuricauda sp.]|nr:MAG: class I SAM-dependent methyltransferase [Allomuricauda sp.]